MKLQFLQTLAAVLRHGSFAAAAKDVSLTASAVGLQMRQLEEYFGQPLFDRSARQVRPTPFALEIADTLNQTVETLEALRSRKGVAVSGRIRLATVESVQVAMLPTVLQRLRERAPGLEIGISKGLSSPLIDDVKAGRVDAAVLVQPQSGGSSRLAWFPLARESMVMIAPPTARPALPVELLRRYDWIRMDPATTGGRIAAQYVQRIAPRLRWAFDLPGTEAIAAMVSAGIGVSVVPMPRSELLVAYPMLQVPLGRGAPQRQLAMVCRPADADSRLMQVVLEAFQGAARKRYGDDAVTARKP